MGILKHIASSTFLRQNGILFFGALAAGLLNYLFYPVIGRLLSPVAFGEVQAIFSLFLQLTIFLTVLSVVVVFIVANYKRIAERNAAVFELEKASLWVAAASLVAALIFGDWLREFFKFESATPFVLLGLLVLVSVPFAFRTAFLRGRRSFLASTIANIAAASGKFAFSVPLVLLGGGANGALLGVAIGQFVALAYAAWRARVDGLVRPASSRLWTRPDIKKIWPEIMYSLWVLAGSLAVMLQLTVDTVVVKHLFDAHTAGLYAGVVTVARTIFFLTAPIVLALLPAVKVEAAPKQNRAWLLKSLALFGVVSIPLLALMVLLPTQVTTVLMGPQYAEIADLLPLLALTTFATSLLNVVVSYFLALKKYISAFLAIMGVAVTFGLMIFRHGSPQAVVQSLCVGSMVSMCLIAIWICRTHLSKRRGIDETTTTIHSGSGSQRV